MKNYSPLFETLYDQTEPVGHLGRGTHYSVLRAASWKNASGQLVDRALLHCFAVLWDEDHDERIIPVLEDLHLEGLLSPVVFVGERKGGISLVVSPAFSQGDAKKIASYAAQIEAIAEDQEDPWTVDVVSLHDPETSIVNDTWERVHAYLQGILVLWPLGLVPAEQRRKNRTLSFDFPTS